MIKFKGKYIYFKQNIMQTRNLEIYRWHAEATSALNLSLPPALSSAPREDASKAMNRLRLTMYIQQIDGSTYDIVNNASDIESWINSHTIETQVFLNALWAGIAEDGVRGPQTVRCIKRLLDINTTSILSNTATAVTAGTISASVNEAGETVYDLPEFMQDEEQIRGMLEQLGIDGLRIEDGKLVGRMELDTQEKLRKLEEYLDFANYIESEGATGAGKVERYKKLLDDSTDYIWDKQYLIQKYMISMYKDLTEVGCTIRQDGVNGEYVIAGMRATPDVVRLQSEIYWDIVSGWYARTAFIEFARIYGIVESSNNPRFHEQAVSREGLVLHILQNNSIISRILDPEIQSVEALLLNKDEVVTQLATAIEGLAISSDDPNFHHYQEVIWLHDFLKHENYKQDDIQRDIFNQVNHYKNVFLKEHSFIDALSAEGIDPNDIDPNDDTVVGKLEKVLGRNSPALYMIGILMLLFKDSRKWGFGLILGTMAAKAGLSIASDSGNEFGMTDTGNTVGDAFDIFHPIDLRHEIDYPDTFNRENYDPTLTKLFDANDTRRDDGEIVNATAVNHTNNAKIAFIFQAIMQDGTKLDEEFASGDTEALISGIHWILGANPAVTEASFPGSRVPTEQQGPVEESDVRVFIDLLRDIGDGDDTTLGDLLYEGGIDRLGSEYSSDWYAFTEYGKVDTAFDDIFRPAWNAGNREIRMEITKTLEDFDKYLYSGTTDAMLDAWNNASGTWAAFNNIFAEAKGISVDDRVSRAWDLKAAIDGWNLDDTTKNGLKDILDKYTTLLQKEEDFNNLRNPWYKREGQQVARIAFTDAITFWSDGSTQTEVQYENIQRNVNNKISELEALKATLGSEPLYQDLVGEIDAEIAYLNGVLTDAYAHLVELATVGSILNGNAPAEDIKEDLGLARVTHVVWKLHDELRESISWGIETSVFGITESQIKQAVIEAYRAAKAGSITGVNASATQANALWHGLRTVVEDSINAAVRTSVWNIPFASSIIGEIDIVWDIPPADVVILDNGDIQTETIDNIVATIQLEIARRYFANQESRLEDLKRIRDAYKSILDGINPPTRDQTALLNLLDGEYQTLLDDIEAQIKTLIENYDGSGIQTEIEWLNPDSSRPSVNPLEDGNLDNFLRVAAFLENNGENDWLVVHLKAQAERFFGTPNDLEDMLVSTTNLADDFETKKSELRDYIEQTTILSVPTTIPTPPNPDSSKALENISLLRKAKDILGTPTWVIDTKIGTWETYFENIATIGDIEYNGVNLSDALSEDINTLEWLKNDFDLARMSTTDDKYLVVVELITIFTRAKSNPTQNYKNFKVNEIQSATIRWTSTINLWAEIQSGTYEWKSIQTSEILNNI